MPNASTPVPTSPTWTSRPTAPTTNAGAAAVELMLPETVVTTPAESVVEVELTRIPLPTLPATVTVGPPCSRSSAVRRERNVESVLRVV